jgi:outer membrane protein assembly factor BamB
MVVVGAGDGRLHALGAADGKPRWTYACGDRIVGSANWLELAGSGRSVVAGSYDNAVHCVDAGTGKLRWKYETGYFVNGSPAVYRTNVVFGGCDAVLHVVSGSTGTAERKIEAGSYIAGSAAVDGGVAYVGNYGGSLIAADLRTGRTLWEYAEKTGGSPLISSPALSKDRVVVGARDQQVHCVRRDNGEQVWTFRTRGDVDSSPVICDGKVVVGSGDGRLYVLRLSNGEVLWSHDVGAGLPGSPAVAMGMVVIGAEDGTLYAFGGEP